MGELTTTLPNTSVKHGLAAGPLLHVDGAELRHTMFAYQLTRLFRRRCIPPLPVGFVLLRRSLRLALVQRRRLRRVGMALHSGWYSFSYCGSVCMYCSGWVIVFDLSKQAEDSLQCGNGYRGFLAAGRGSFAGDSVGGSDRRFSETLFASPKSNGRSLPLSIPGTYIQVPS